MSNIGKNSAKAKKNSTTKTVATVATTPADKRVAVSGSAKLVSPHANYDARKYNDISSLEVKSHISSC